MSDSPVGKVKTWRYFEEACAEEQYKAALTAAGIRPGDAYGKHRYTANGGEHG